MSGERIKDDENVGLVKVQALLDRIVKEPRFPLVMEDCPLERSYWKFLSQAEIYRLSQI